MYKIKIVLLLCAATALAACGNSGSSNRSNAADNVTPTTTTQGTTLSYMDYIKKMVASSSDDTEPVDVELVKVEQSDDAETVEVM